MTLGNAQTCLMMRPGFSRGTFIYPFLWRSILLLQLLFSMSFVLRNEASSPITGKTDIAVIYNPCE